MQTGLEKVIKENKGTIVDVRTVAEFSGGHVDGSVNIPIQEIPERMKEIEAMDMPLILCCASGNRSGQVQRYLSRQGIDCINGGGWKEVNYIKSQNSSFH